MVWYVDASQIDIELEEFQDHLLLTNGQIDSFIEGRGRRLFVAGAKGTGKSLLLRLKRANISKNQIGVLLYPNGLDVDRFVDISQIFSKKNYGDLYTTVEYWQRIWLISLIMTVLKHTTRPILDLSGPADALYNSNITQCSDIFDRLLQLSRNDYFKVYDDLRTVLKPEIRMVDQAVALFIDNVDEYFKYEDQRSAQPRGTQKDDSNSARPKIWHYSQIGLLNAIWDLDALNNHIKVYCSIRIEAYNHLLENDPRASQLSGSTSVVRYEKSELQEILAKNIQSERSRNMVSPGSGDPLVRFFGEECLQIPHAFTGEVETIDDFIIRHTLWRPREIATMGEAISEIAPKDRTRAKVCRLVNKMASEIAGAYTTECAPYLKEIDENSLYRTLDTNVIPKERLGIYVRKYNRLALNDEDADFNVFHQLYRIGLLGILRRDGPNDIFQQYFPPLGISLKEKSSAVPASQYYLIHPILYERIALENASFWDGLDKVNIVGRGRPWRDKSDICFVAKGDVVKYSKIMADPDKSAIFPRSYEQIVSDVVRSYKLTHGAVEGGDSVLLFDRNPYRLNQAVQTVIQCLRDHAACPCEIRFGGDAGILRYDTKNGHACNLKGGSLRTSARLEGVVEPGSFFVTDNFVRHAKNFDRCPSFEMIGQNEIKATKVGEKFNLQKNDAEEPILHEVFRTELKA